MALHKIFISYYHGNQSYKDGLVKFSSENNIFINNSVENYDIDADLLTDESIRQIIRDKYIQDTTVTIVLVGKNTRYRKHVDWEIGSTMIDGTINKRGGILVIYLPGYENSIYLPSRLKDQDNRNLNIGYLNWNNITVSTLSDSIDNVYETRKIQNYDTSRPFRKRNN